jgi:hypothetical protein
VYVRTYVFISVCVYVHTYLCMYIHARTHTHTSALRGTQRDARVWPRVHVPAVNPQTRCSLPLLLTVVRGRENRSPEALIYIYIYIYIYYTHTQDWGLIVEKEREAYADYIYIYIFNIT